LGIITNIPALAKIVYRELFTKELELELLNGYIDIAANRLIEIVKRRIIVLLDKC
jgi:hypothetical protein